MPCFQGIYVAVFWLFLNVLVIKEKRKRKAKQCGVMSAGGGLHLHPLPRPLTHTIKKPDINYLLFCRQEAALLLKGAIYPPLELYLISNEQNCNEGDAVSCANTANTDKLKVIKSVTTLTFASQGVSIYRLSW